MKTTITKSVRSASKFEHLFISSGCSTNRLFTLLLLACFFICCAETSYAGSINVTFTGNKVIDVIGGCSWSGGYTGATLIIKRDGIEVARSSTETEPNNVELYYRDTAVSKGSSYEYLECCIMESERGETESCRPNGVKATAGEVGGTLGMDLEMSGEPILLYKKINIDDGVTLSISDSTVERAPEAVYAGTITSLHPPSVAGSGSGGTIRISNSTIGPKVSLQLKSAGENLLSDNTFEGTRVDIDDETNIMIRGNTFIDMEIEIDGGTTSHIIKNTFRSASLDIGDYKGDPKVLIDGNDILGPETGLTIDISGGETTMQGNIITGPYSEKYEGNVAHGISIRHGNYATNVIVDINDNMISGFRDAIELGEGADVKLSGNVIKDNETGLVMNKSAFAEVTENTFTGNKYGVEFNYSSINLTNNCIEGNENGFINKGAEDLVDATGNWWGDASGPNHLQTNSEGQGDKIFDSWGLVSFSPWLTASNCMDTPDLPEPEPATITVTSSPTTIAADGQSQTTVTIVLKGEDGQPLSNAEITLLPPEYGSFSSLSGLTDSNGRLEVIYTAPSADELAGHTFVELIAQYSEVSVTDSTIVTFSFAKIDCWAEPHTSPFPSDAAIIPGDSRFPARYQFTLLDQEGKTLEGETLSLSIDDPSIARLEGGSLSGREIEVITDSQGKVSVDYIYLGKLDIENAPFEDTITVKHNALSVPFEAMVSIGLDIDITEVNTPQQDTGVFPKTLGMRLTLTDYLRPGLDLRAYLSKLEEISGKNVALQLDTDWLNPPRPEIQGLFSSILPDFSPPSTPTLYEGTGVINYGDAALSQVIVEALDEPQATFGVNTLPAITFQDAGNYWFSVKANPVVLPKGATSSTDYIQGISRSGSGRMFGANVLEGAESVFQSVVCSVKPTGKAQFAAMTLLVDNPYFDILPPSAAIKMGVKISGIICDYMQGNYATAAINMVSLTADGLENAYTSGMMDITLDQYLKLGKIVRLNQTYSRFDNLKSAKETFMSKSANYDYTLSFQNDWPEGLTVTEYNDIINTTVAGEMAAYEDLSGWQSFAILTEDDINFNTTPDETEYFSSNGIKVLMLPEGQNSFSINTTESTDIYRFSRSTTNEVVTADYSFAGSDGPAILSLSLDNLDMQVDRDADGTMDELFSPEISTVQTSVAWIEISGDKDELRAGDTFILSASLENPGDPLAVDVYLLLLSPDNTVFSFPDMKVGLKPLVKNYTLPANFFLSETDIFSLNIPEGVSGLGTFQIAAAITYPDTTQPVAGKISMITITFP